MKKTIYFVRHGESDANVDGVISGAEHNAQLTTQGKKQAKLAGDKLKNKNIELIVASPLDRTQETAKIISDQISYNGEILTNELFIERGMGDFSGKNKELLKKHIQSGKDDKQVGLEDKQEFYNRISQAFNWLRNRTEKNILVVSHGGTGRMTRVINKQLEPKHLDDPKRIGRLDNCQIDKFEL